MAARKDAATWALIEAEYRSGKDSVRAIADRHGLSEAAVRKRAKAEGWTRPIVLRALAIPAPDAARTAPPEPDTDDAAELARRGRGLVGRLMHEVDAITTHQGELEQLIELETVDDRSPRRREAMLRAIGLGGRALTIKALAGALASLSEGGGAPKGKKELAAERAKEAGALFAPMAPPGPSRAVN